MEEGAATTRCDNCLWDEFHAGMFQILNVKTLSVNCWSPTTMLCAVLCRLFVCLSSCLCVCIVFSLVSTSGWVGVGGGSELQAAITLVFFRLNWNKLDTVIAMESVIAFISSEE